MLGTRTRIVLLSLFFAFSFALLFLALVQNHVQAKNILLSHSRFVALVETPDSETSLVYGVTSSFWWGQYKPPWFDLDSDDSFQKYLSTDHPLNDPWYTPTDLVPIDSNFTANNAKAFKLRKEAALQFADMAWHFRNVFSWDRLYISSAWRSRGLQDYLIKQGCSLKKCAQIGTSEHQVWLAVDVKAITRWGRGYSLDVTKNSNKYYDWLKANAAKFGFHNTYQKGVEIDGKITEWRHRRYVWVELATILAEKGETFAEYYNWIKNE